MFKYTIAVAVAAMAASASPAVNVSTPSADHTRQEPSTAATISSGGGNAMTGHKTVARRSEKTAFLSGSQDAYDPLSSSSSDDLIVAGVLGLLETVSVPKQLLGAAVGHVVRKLKSVDVKRLWKSAVLGALVTALGAAAAVAVAGLVSGVCALLSHADQRPYNGRDHPQTDIVGDFVLDAFGAYGKRR